MSLLKVLIKCYFKVVSFKLCFESVNVHSQTYALGKRVPQGRPRTAPGMVMPRNSQHHLAASQLIEGRGSAGMV